MDLKVDNPSNIKWENIEIKNRGLRLCCAFIIMLCLMVMTFGIIIGANIAKPPSP